VEAELGETLTRVDPAAIQPAPSPDRSGHVGIHAQKQQGLCYIGVVCPVGRLTADRMRGLADIADQYGSGELRLTVWQNLLIPDVAEADIQAAVAAIEALGLSTQASPLRTGLVACTGNAGCKFAASDTKGQAAALVDYLDPRITLDAPINIHLTGCHHSCAQHYIADIGLLAAKVEQGEDMIEGYDLLVGGGAGPDQAIGRLIRPGVPFADLPPMVLALLSAWQTERASGESFQAWTASRSDATLASVLDPATADAA
jgi:ferredoxin-nitrite reductase